MGTTSLLIRHRISFRRILQIGRRSFILPRCGERCCSLRWRRSLNPRRTRPSSFPSCTTHGLSARTYRLGRVQPNSRWRSSYRHSNRRARHKLSCQMAPHRRMSPHRRLDHTAVSRRWKQKRVWRMMNIRTTRWTSTRIGNLRTRT